MASATRPRGGSHKRARATSQPLPEPPTMPRTGAKRTAMYYIKQFPAYLRLLGGLLMDRRVNALDKLMVAGAMAYIVMPLDIIPDFIPFLGEVDDLYLLLFALQRLISNTGRNVLYSHWTGAVEDLKDLNLQAAISAAAFFLPRRIRRRLRVIGR
ncbi:MAG TPA: YkvA family protein [Gemmatimonadaceae bacterium]|nr:YkvA family protein [Gemmatimonadaceae bacterium]